MAPNTPLLERFEPDLWSLSTQRQLFQQAGEFSEVRDFRSLSNRGRVKSCIFCSFPQEEHTCFIAP
jgi:hypothetical protein